MLIYFYAYIRYLNESLSLIQQYKFFNHTNVLKEFLITFYFGHNFFFVTNLLLSKSLIKIKDYKGIFSIRIKKI